MDSLFLDVVLLLIGGSLDDLCPTPPCSTSIICGAAISKRKANTRIEVWLGGTEAPEAEWINSIQRHFTICFQGNKIYPYRSFQESTEVIVGTR
jgi:hypothetical protein